MLVLDQQLKNRLAYLNFDAFFLVPWTISYKMHILFFRKMLLILELLGAGGTVPP